MNRKFPYAAALEDLPESAVLDGEFVAMGAVGGRIPPAPEPQICPLADPLLRLRCVDEQGQIGDAALFDRNIL